MPVVNAPTHQRTNALIIICGPTAVGKTRIGIELAKHFNGEIVSADSQQVYRGLDIGTAKPSAEERAAVKHHLMDVVSPDQPFDVAKFVELADEAISAIAASGRVPFVVGGTGLYIRALTQGLVEAPGRDEKFREDLKNIETPKLHEMLSEKDPETAARLNSNDTTRIVRALEVLHLTGRSISEIQKDHEFKEKRYQTLKIGLNVEREELYRRINERADKMIEAGLVEEVGGLVEKYGPDCQALRALGYNELVHVIASGAKQSSALDCHAPSGLAMTVNQIKQNTRRYAKRQLTWFRTDPEIRWFEPGDVEKMKKVVEIFLQR